MKILYHHRTQGRGVEGVHIRGMVDAFKKLGHDVVIISPPGVDPYSRGVAKTDPSDRMSGHAGAARFWKWLGKNLPEIGFEIAELLYNIWAYLALKDAVTKERFDFIYERYALNTFAGAVVSGRFKIPLISEVNDSAHIERVRKLAMTGVARAVEGKVFRGATAIFTISSYFKNVIADTGVEEKKVFVLPNAVDETVFAMQEGGDVRGRYSLDSNIVIGYAGAFVYWHGVELLLESFAKLSKAHKNLRLLLVGEGVTFDSAKKFARENRMEDLIILPGRVPHEDMPSYIAAMDVCVIPDSNRYGSPVKLFEYMAMGKPIVAPGLAPMRDVINDGENGILFEPRNGAGLDIGLGRLISDAALRRNIGDAARESVFRNHTWTRNAEKVISVANDHL